MLQFNHNPSLQYWSMLMDPGGGPKVVSDSLTEGNIFWGKRGHLFLLNQTNYLNLLFRDSRFLFESQIRRGDPIPELLYHSVLWHHQPYRSNWGGFIFCRPHLRNANKMHSWSLIHFYLQAQTAMNMYLIINVILISGKIGILSIGAPY